MTGQLCIISIVNIVGMLTLMQIYKKMERILLSKDQRIALVHATFWAVSTFIWVFLWFYVVPSEFRLSSPLSYLGLIWPVIISLFHVLQSNHHSEDHLKGMQRTAMHWDSNAIVGLCFTVGTLLTDASVRSNRHLTIMLLTPIILCLCFILSMPFLDSSSIEGVLVRMIHKLAINASIGILLTGIIIRITHPSLSTTKGISRK